LVFRLRVRLVHDPVASVVNYLASVTIHLASRDRKGAG
jgi:hypothetical protein